MDHEQYMSITSSIESVTVDRLPGDLNRHFHEDFSITVILEGECSVLVEDELHTLNSGDTVLIPGYMPHACINSPDTDLSYRVIMIPGNIMKRCSIPQRFDIVKSSELKYGRFNLTGIENMINRVTGIRPAGVSINSFRSPEGGKSSSMKRVADYITAGWQGEVTLDELADVSGLSKYHLVKKFREEFGMTPHAYSINVRINRARELLKSGRPLADISLELGFYDQSHFSNTFLKYTGLTPLGYRKLFT